MDSFDKMSNEELDALLINSQKAQPPVRDNFDSMSDEQLDKMLISNTINQYKPPQDTSRPVEAAISGFGNAASFGYLPQIQAAAEPFIQGALDFFGGDNVDDQLKAQGFDIQEAPKKSYVQRRDDYIKADRQLAAENPLSYMSGGVAGGITSGIATGGGLSSLFGKASTVAGRAKQAVGAGATIGALRNPGDTEGEVSPLQLNERLENAVKDGATGLLVQGGLEGLRTVAKTAKDAGKGLKYWSQNKALKAAGADKPAFKKAILNKKNTDLGQTVIDEKLIGQGDDVRDIAKNAEKALADSNNKLNAVYKKAESAPGGNLRQEDVMEILGEYSDEAAGRLNGTVDGDAIAAKLGDVLETMPRGKNPTFGELRKWRASIDKKINYAKANQDMPEFQAELVRLRSKVQEKIGEKIGRIDPALKKEFTRQNKRTANLFEIKDIANKKSAGVDGNTSWGMREGFGGTIGSVIGAGIGGPIGAGAGALLGSITTNVARKHGTPFVAMTANKVARALENNNPAIQKFAKPLMDAATKSPKEYVATVNALLKDPEFRESVNMVEPQQMYRGPAER